MAKSNTEQPTPTPNPESASEAPQSNDSVQLTCNKAGHHVGETFKRSAAEKLGIIDHCRPFPGTKDRQVKPTDVTTR